MIWKDEKKTLADSNKNDFNINWKHQDEIIKKKKHVLMRL